MIPEHLKKELNTAHGVTELPPLVCFFDYAVPDKAATKESGRPRFKDVVYIEKKPRGGMVRDAFRAKATEEDKIEYEDAWEAYCKQKEQMKTRAPSIAAIPGMTVAISKELEALKIQDCQQLAEYDPIEGIEHIQSFAKRIMELSNESPREVREERVPVQGDPVRPAHNRSQEDWPEHYALAGDSIGRELGTVSSIDECRKPVQAEGDGKREMPDAPVTFTYEFST